MVNFWISFLFLLVNWGLALTVEGVTARTIFASGFFFALYFLIPLLKIRMAQLVFFLLPLFLTAAFLSPGFNGFVWLIFLTLGIQSADIFGKKGLALYISYLYALAVLPSVVRPDWLSVSFLTLLAGITGILYVHLKRATEKKRNLEKQHENLKDEFQLLKRQLISGEKMVRQEERNQIAREIHDSVGHRLTALLMQMEAARIQAADEETKAKFLELKKLAQTSLDDTRDAVQTLKSEETAGIQAVIQLIRKLEVESQVRLSITMQTGVLSAVLSNQQSVVIYRSLQEALTNMMRHSTSRQASIEFQIVADKDLRFQVSHPLKEKVAIKEGFGLTNMRERLAEIGGRLTIRQTTDQFQLIGQFPLEVKQDG